MAEIGLRGVLLLFISLTKYLEGAKLLAGLKKCGDLECESKFAFFPLVLLKVEAQNRDVKCYYGDA